MHFLWLLLFCSVLSAQDVALLEELEMMYEQDQTARFEMIHTGVSDKLEKIDQDNLIRLKAIVEEFGWPGFQLVGEEGSRKMWLLVQHCDKDLEFQKICLKLIQKAVLQEDASKEHLAYLTDRILVHEGYPQLYGTQVQLTEEDPIPQPIADAHNLDVRRAEMGLTPYSEYLAFLKQVYRK